MEWLPSRNPSGKACGPLGLPDAPYHVRLVARLWRFAEPSRLGRVPQRPSLGYLFLPFYTRLCLRPHLDCAGTMSLWWGWGGFPVDYST